MAAAAAAAAARPVYIIMLLTIILPSVYCGPHRHHHHQKQQVVHQQEVWAPGVSSEWADEFEMSSEVSRRILATTRYISYNALRRDSTPCSRRGASYYNCRPGAQANPYSRGCSAITHCRS